MTGAAHQLQIVDDNQLQIMLQFVFTALGAQFGDRDTGGVVNDQLGTANGSGSLDELLSICILQITGTKELGIHSGFQRKQTVHQLFL